MPWLLTTCGSAGLRLPLRYVSPERPVQWLPVGNLWIHARVFWFRFPCPRACKRPAHALCVSALVYVFVPSRLLTSFSGINRLHRSDPSQNVSDNNLTGWETAHHELLVMQVPEHATMAEQKCRHVKGHYDRPPSDFCRPRLQKKPSAEMMWHCSLHDGARGWPCGTC